MNGIDRVARALAILGLGIALIQSMPSAARAQQTGSVSGTVTAQGTLAPLEGVEVSIPTLGLDAVTDDEGRFVLSNVPVGNHVMRARMLGFETHELNVTVQVAEPVTADITLSEEAIELSELVVTALGVTREQRAIGYAVQDMTGEQVAQAVETNVVNALTGEVAGLQVTNVGPAGGSARIVLRGTGSIAGENQPLFIIDGIPVDNSSSSYLRAGRRRGGVDPTDPTPAQSDYGNAIRDINPEDIESLTVLKGANAAALYGSRAANGVIVITTKKGSSGGAGLSMTATSNITVSTPLIKIGRAHV